PAYGGRRDRRDRYIRVHPPAERALELLRDGQHLHLAATAADHLYGHRQALLGACDRHRCCGQRHRVHVGREREEVDLVVLLAVDRERLRADREGRHRGYWRDRDRVALQPLVHDVLELGDLHHPPE